MNSNITQIAIEPIMYPTDSSTNEKIRRTSDGRVSVFDLISVVGGQKNPYEVLERLQNRFPDVLTVCENFKFPGRGQKPTPVTDKIGALKLIGILPGETGKKYREEAARLVLAWYENPDVLAVNAFDKIKDSKLRSRSKIRIDGIESRKKATDIYKDTGLVTEPRHYGILTNTTYKSLLGADANTLKANRGITNTSNLRDALSDVELAALSLAEAIACEKINTSKPSTFNELKSIVATTGQRVGSIL